MTGPDRDNVWNARRRLGDALRRWAGSTARPGPPGTRHTHPLLESPRRSSPLDSQRAGLSRIECPPARPRIKSPRKRWYAPQRWWGSGWWQRAGRDRGAATVFVLAIGLVLVAAGAAGAAIGAARVGRHQAQLAADLGALAGAARAIDGQAAACAAAARFVDANQARMSSCEVQGLEIVVQAEVEVIGLPGPARVARAAARAGPVSTI